MIDKKLFDACINEDFKKIMKLHKKGHDINSKDDLTGENLLFKMISFDNEKIASFLIDLGADVNNSDYGGKTVLMEAVAKNTSLKFVKKLIENGADLNKTDNKGGNVLWWASDNSVALYLKSLGLKIKKKISHINFQDSSFKDYYIIKTSSEFNLT